MQIELPDVIYETFFQHAQLEITGICNMRCQHCRAWEEASIHMPLDLVRKILQFAKANAESNFRLTISGGEPFLHPSVVEVVNVAKALGMEDIIITTNGSLVSDALISNLKDIGVKNLCIQVSVDSTIAEEHDAFRGHKGAFEKATSCLRRVSAKGMASSLRATIHPGTIEQIPKLIALARSCGAIRVGIGSVIPAGRAKENKSLLMSSKDKERFIGELATQKRANPDIDVTTEDPLKFALDDCPWDYGEGDISSVAFFGGCTAGVTGFNADTEGTLTPCAVLLKPIVNVRDKTVEEITVAYASSEVIRQLVARNFTGKCGKCSLNRLCGGCRAVANGVSDDYMSSDTTCWK